jgi:hypothetical protein
MKLLGRKFINKVLNHEVDYQSAKHKRQNIIFAINEAVKEYDLEALIKVCEEGLVPWNEGLGGFPPSRFPAENAIRRLMVAEKLTYEDARAKFEGALKEFDEDVELQPKAPEQEPVKQEPVKQEETKVPGKLTKRN